MHDSGLVRLNIGGVRFETTLTTLTGIPGSYFDVLLSNRWAGQVQNGEFFIDRDGTAFRHVLNFLREGVISRSILSKGELYRLVHDADFYNLPQLLEQLKPSAQKIIFDGPYCNPPPSSNREVWSLSKDGCCLRGLQMTGDVFGSALPVLVGDIGQTFLSVSIRSLKAGCNMVLGLFLPKELTTETLDKYAWGCHRIVYVLGSRSPLFGYDGWLGFEEGDEVLFKVDREQALLSMRVKRLETRTFKMYIPRNSELAFFALIKGLGEIELLEEVDLRMAVETNDWWL